MQKRSRKEERRVRYRLVAFCLAMFVIVVGLVLIWRTLPYGAEPKPEPTVNAPVVKTPEPEPTPVATTTTVRERPAGMICDETNAICVSQSYQNVLLASPFSVTGTAIADLGNGGFYWRLEDASGTIAQDYAKTTAQDIGEVGSFEIRDFLMMAPRSTTGTLVLFEKERENGADSPQIEGSQTHVLKIPVRFSREKMTVVIDGSDVTIAKTKFPIESTIRLVLKDEKGIELESMTFSKGILNVILFVSDARNLERVTEKLKKTTVQFSYVKSVNFIVDEMGDGFR